MPHLVPCHLAGEATPERMTYSGRKVGGSGGVWPRTWRLSILSDAIASLGPACERGGWWHFKARACRGSQSREGSWATWQRTSFSIYLTVEREGRGGRQDGAAKLETAPGRGNRLDSTTAVMYVVESPVTSLALPESASGVCPGDAPPEKSDGPGWRSGVVEVEWMVAHGFGGSRRRPPARASPHLSSTGLSPDVALRLR